jgi:replication factor A1
MAPAARMSMTRRVFPLVSLNPYQGSWTIKVRVTSKGNMRTYKNARGEGCVFNVELTDEDVSHNKHLCSKCYVGCKLFSQSQLSGKYDSLVPLFQGTQIQATMFNEAAKKFFDRFQLGKVYYISKGSLKLANKQFKTVKNDYEMTLNENSVVEEAGNEEIFVPETKFNFVQIDELGPYVNARELVGKNPLLENVCLHVNNIFLPRIC